MSSTEGTGAALVRVDRQGKVAELVLDNPPVNALTKSLLKSWRVALDSLDGSIRVVIVRSALAETFMTGGDIDLLANGSPDQLTAYVLEVQRAFSQLTELSLPVICLVDGHCLGGGLELALAADIVVSTNRSTFGLPEVRLGILPAGGGVHRLLRRVGEGRGRRLLLTGGRFDAQRAFDLGVIDDLVAQEDGLDHARAIAADIAALPQAAVEAIKRLSGEALDQTVTAGLERELAEWQAIRATSETQAALQAFFTRGTQRGAR